MRLPKYRHYKPRYLAFVEIDGKRFYLGRYDSPESRNEYQRILNELYLKRQNKLPEHSAFEQPRPLSELLLTYLQ